MPAVLHLFSSLELVSNSAVSVRLCVRRRDLQADVGLNTNAMCGILRSVIQLGPASLHLENDAGALVAEPPRLSHHARPPVSDREYGRCSVAVISHADVRCVG